MDLMCALRWFLVDFLPTAALPVYEMDKNALLYREGYGIVHPSGADILRQGKLLTVQVPLMTRTDEEWEETAWEMLLLASENRPTTREKVKDMSFFLGDRNITIAIGLDPKYLARFVDKGDGRKGLVLFKPKSIYRVLD